MQNENDGWSIKNVVDIVISSSCRIWCVAQVGHPWPQQLHQEALQVKQTAIPESSLHQSGTSGPSGGVCGGSSQLCDVDRYTGVHMRHRVLLTFVLLYSSFFSCCFSPFCLAACQWRMWGWWSTMLWGIQTSIHLRESWVIRSFLVKSSSLTAWSCLMKPCSIKLRR